MCLKIVLLLFVAIYHCRSTTTKVANGSVSLESTSSSSQIKDQGSSTSNELQPSESLSQAYNLEDGEPEDKETWQAVVEKVQFVMTVFGCTANIVTLVALVRNGGRFNESFCLLVKHQSLIDSAVCLMAGTVLMQPTLWTTGVIWLDAIVCFVWHSQAIYWLAVFMSVWNLVFLSAERYAAVCLPFVHNNLTQKKLKRAILFLYPFSVIASSLCFVQNKFDFDSDKCLVEFLIPGKLGEDIFYGYAIACLFLYYLAPIIAYVVMYSRILYTLKMRTKSTELTASKVIESASDSMTKAAIALTLIFAFSIGYDLWYYTLGYTGVVPYETDSSVQKIGVFLAVFNSCVNPCVYAVLMPAYRNSVKKTLIGCWPCITKTSNVPSEEGTASSRFRDTSMDSSSKRTSSSSLARVPESFF